MGDHALTGYFPRPFLKKTTNYFENMRIKHVGPLKAFITCLTVGGLSFPDLYIWMAYFLIVLVYVYSVCVYPCGGLPPTDQGYVIRGSE